MTKNDCKEYGTNKVSIENTINTEWNEMKCVNQCRNYCLILTRSARMEETSMNEIKSINQYSKLISIEHTGMNH